jgi:hypothetical protein
MCLKSERTHHFRYFDGETEGVISHKLSPDCIADRWGSADHEVRGRASGETHR